MTQNTETISIFCNVCGSDRSKPLWTAVDRLAGFEGQFQYVRCANCGLVYMNPQIAPTCISRFYPADYAPHQFRPERPDKADRPDLPEIILDTLDSQSRVLDVGCGSGEFLHQLRRFRRCRVSGLDISENAVLCARDRYDLDVFQGEISACPFEDGSFDLITMRSCIEHLHNPAEAMRKASALCRPRGWLFIKTPNFDSFAAKLFGDKWYHLDCPRHLYIFSPSTITALLKKHGFEVITVRHEASSKGWFGSLQYVFYGDNYRPDVKNKIRRSALVKSFVSPISRLSAWLKQADTMEVVARRKRV